MNISEKGRSLSGIGSQLCKGWIGGEDTLPKLWRENLEIQSQATTWACLWSGLYFRFWNHREWKTQYFLCQCCGIPLLTHSHKPFCHYLLRHAFQLLHLLFYMLANEQACTAPLVSHNSLSSGLLCKPIQWAVCSSDKIIKKSRANIYVALSRYRGKSLGQSKQPQKNRLLCGDVNILFWCNLSRPLAYLRR